MFPNENKSSSEEGIHITNRQASILVALFLFLGLSVFIIGYFLGKKSMLDSLTDSFEQQLEKFDPVTEPVSDFEGAPDVSSVTQDFAHDNSATNSEAIKSVVEEKEESIQKNIDSEKNNSTTQKDLSNESKAVHEAPISARAQLIGFGVKKSALAFKKRLEDKGIEIIIETKSSKTAKGKNRVWYQAVTPIFDSLHELDKVIKKIQKLEFIRTKDINIVHIKEQKG